MKAGSIALFACMIGCAVAPHDAAAEVHKFKEIVLHSFGDGTDDGVWPTAGLINVKGTLYGTTEYGGTYGYGTVFALDPRTGAETIVHAFGYGADGEALGAGLIVVKGMLYGTTAEGGTYDEGTVFVLDPKTSTETVLYSFGGYTGDGRTPTSSLINVEGVLYGTTLSGGANSCGSDGCGTVFALDPKTRTETVLHSFGKGTDGQGPAAGLIKVKGKLIGTTSGGGTDGCGFTSGCGTVFALDPTTGKETVLYSFCSQPNCIDGTSPYADLIAMNGIVYSTTNEGGANGHGAVFALDPTTRRETVLYSFCSQPNCTDGQFPYAGVIDAKGTLYGTTDQGGSNAGGCNGYGCGTAFALNPTTGKETVLYSFCSQPNCTDGWQPEANLIYVKGTLYGTTIYGGAHDDCDKLSCGTVFALHR